MTTKSLIAGMPDYVRFGLGGLALFVPVFFKLIDDSFFETNTAIFFLGLSLMPALLLRYQANISISRTILATAIPAGLFQVLIGFYRIFYGRDSADFTSTLGSGASTMLLGAFYGGVLALFAHAYKSEKHIRQEPIKPQHFISVLSFIVWVITCVFYVIHMQGSPIAIFLSPRVISVFMTLIALFFVARPSLGLARILSDASIIGIMICILISLNYWWQGLPSDDIPERAMEVATLGMLYGTILFMSSYYVSLFTGETDDINFEIKNWHLIESAALYILLVFAPPSIFELAV